MTFDWRWLIFSLAAAWISAEGAAQAFADAYQVVPIHGPMTNHPSASYIYKSLVFDNKKGNIFVCNVQVAFANTPIEPHCYKYGQSQISPDESLVAVSEFRRMPDADERNNKTLTTGIWQINTRTGDLQFCLAPDYYFNYSPPIQGCFRVDWPH